MAMSADRIADDMLNRLESALGFTFTAPQRVQAKKVWKAYSEAILAELAAYSVITIPATTLAIAGSSGLTEINNVGNAIPVGGTGYVSSNTLTGKIT